MTLVQWLESTGRAAEFLGKQADDTAAKFREQARAAADFSVRSQEAAAAAEEAAGRADAAAERIAEAGDRARGQVSDLLAFTREALKEADGGFSGFAKNLLDLAAEGGPLSLLKAAARDTRVEVDGELVLLSSLLAEAQAAGQASLAELRREVEDGRRTIEQTLADLRNSTDNAAQAALQTFEQFQRGSDKSTEATRELIRTLELLQRETEPGSRTFLNLEALLRLIGEINQQKAQLDV